MKSHLFFYPLIICASIIVGFAGCKGTLTNGTPGANGLPTGMQGPSDTTQGFGGDVPATVSPVAGSPEIKSVSPSDGAKGVPVNTEVEVVFNQPMNASTINAETFVLKSERGTISGEVSYLNDTNTAVFKLRANLGHLVTYTALLKQGMEDENGVPLTSDYAWSFTTKMNTWAKVYGGPNDDEARDVKQTKDGGYIVAGKTKSFGVMDEDAWIIKLNSDGMAEWQKAFGSRKSDKVNAVRETKDGGYVVAGQTDSFGDGLYYDALVLKLDQTGTVEWKKRYGGDNFDIAESIQQTKDGGYVIAGRTASSNDNRSFDLWLFKINSDGSEVEWQKAYGGGMAYDVHQTSDGGYIVAGVTSVLTAGLNDMWVLKLDSKGEVEWQKTYGSSGDDMAFSIQEIPGNGYIVAGHTTSFGAGGQDVWILKLNSAGNVEWQKTYGGALAEFAYAIRRIANGDYVVTGYTDSFGTRSAVERLWIFEIDPSGVIKWQKAYEGDSRANAFEQSTDGGYIISGYTSAYGNGGRDFWVLKTDEAGNVEELSDKIVPSEASVADTDVRERIVDVRGVDTAAAINDIDFVVIDTESAESTAPAEPIYQNLEKQRVFTQ